SRRRKKPSWHTDKRRRTSGRCYPRPGSSSLFRRGKPWSESNFTQRPVASPVGFPRRDTGLCGENEIPGSKCNFAPPCLIWPASFRRDEAPGSVAKLDSDPGFLLQDWYVETSAPDDP